MSAGPRSDPGPHFLASLFVLKFGRALWAKKRSRPCGEQRTGRSTKELLIPGPPNNRQPRHQACHPNGHRHPVGPKKSSLHRSPPIYEEFCYHFFRPHVIYCDLLRLKNGEFKARKCHLDSSAKPTKQMNRIGRRTIMCMLLIAALAVIRNAQAGLE